MVNVQTAMDTEGKDAGNIPTGTAFVGAYVSGIDGVLWTPSDIARFPATSIYRIYQGAGTYPGISGYDMLDCESQAVTVAQAVSEIEKREQNGIQWTIVYGSETTLEAVASGVVALGGNYFPGHMAGFLSNWDLDETEAESLLGTTVGGITLVGVQWASPSSNPQTLVPGTDQTLAELNIDLSVVDANFFNAYRVQPTPPPPPAQPLSGMVVYEPSGSDYGAKEVQSADGGKTWTVVQ